MLLALLAAPGARAEGEVALQWLGHSAFLITSPGGVRVLTDPYPPMLGYPHARVPANVVTVSIDLFDHSHLEMAEGKPRVLYGLTLEGEWTEVRTVVGDVKIRGIGAWGDNSGGSQRGKNGMFLFETAGLRILHVGNLGHLLGDEMLRRIGRVDILLLPVGGIYTIDGNEAAQVVKKVHPRLAVPMHYKTPALVFDLQTADKFLKHFPNHQKARDLRVSDSSLPRSTTVLVLDFKQ